MQIKTTVENLKNYQIYLLVLKAIEEFLDKKGYLKIELPVLSPSLIPESYLEIFETEFKYLDKKEKLYLTPSPELFLKRLLAYGVGDCYYLGKSFRNCEPNSSLHSPEFMMLEFYKTKANYMDVAEEVIEMLSFIAERCYSWLVSGSVVNFRKKFGITKKILKQRKHDFSIIYKGKLISFKNWEKISVSEAFKKYAGISSKELFDHQLFIKKAEKKGYQVKGFSYEDVWSQIYSQEIEPWLGKNGYPTLIYDYPKEFAALAKLNPDKKTSQRFEFYIEGIELGDCYTELTDWKEQENRFGQELAKIKKQKKTIARVDKGFIEALKYGLNPCAGIAIGVDRLAMIFCDASSIDKLKLINIT
ncbi:MAG: hypothetical protein QHH09_03370 [Microgenomates group bacterium]|nr:hypothetical protein [Microgenomates group bacterium]